MEEYFDQASMSLESELPKQSSIAKLLINMEDARIGQGYVTAKVENWMAIWSISIYNQRSAGYRCMAHWTT